MSDTSGWRPLSKPLPPDGKVVMAASPFTRLARTHAALVAGDTVVAVALAGSLFFSIDPSAARSKVTLYLLLTMAPFSIVAPLIGPAIDRLAGGRKLVVVASAIARAIACLLMIREIDTLFLFPLAFTQLVSSKSYAIAKSALVPTVVTNDEELVEANSKLGLLSGLMGFAAAAPALLFSLIGPEMVVALGAVVFTVGTVFAFQLPRAVVASTKQDSAERAELRSAGILLAASAMATLRFVVGFLVFLVAFAFRDNGAAKAWYGLVLGASAVGGLVGTAVAPAVRRHVREEVMLVSLLLVTATSGVIAYITNGKPAAAVVAFGIGLGSTAGRLAFDAIVQRDAPDANRGRSFARFETRFQLVWVAGAFLPVVIPTPAWAGYLVIAGVCAFAAVSYLFGTRHVRTKGTLPTPLRTKAIATVKERRHRNDGPVTSRRR